MKNKYFTVALTCLVIGTTFTGCTQTKTESREAKVEEQISEKDTDKEEATKQEQPDTIESEKTDDVAAAEEKTDAAADPENTQTQTSEASSESQNTQDSSTAAKSDTVTDSGVKAAVRVYEGVYFDETMYEVWSSDVPSRPYYQIETSDITDTSFDFRVYEVGSDGESKTLIFKKHTAIFIGSGNEAVYNGKDYTLHFTFTDGHSSLPDVTEIQVSGFSPLEGLTLINNAVPGHEFG